MSACTSTLYSSRIMIDNLHKWGEKELSKKPDRLVYRSYHNFLDIIGIYYKHLVDLPAKQNSVTRMSPEYILYMSSSTNNLHKTINDLIASIAAGENPDWNAWTIHVHHLMVR